MSYTNEEIDKKIEDAINKAVETALMALPLVIRNLIATAVKNQDASKKFYEENKDLANERPFMQAVIEQVEADNPGKSLEDILRIAATEGRRRLSVRDKLPKEVSRPQLSDLDNAVNGAI